MKRSLFSLLLSACLGLSSPVWADGTLTHMSGPVSVQRKDGSSVPGSVGGKVLPGEIVITGPGGYVRMEMTDGSEMVLRPDSQLRLEAYKFSHDRPQEDSFVSSMLKGGLRTVTGLIGKRGDKDAYQLKTNTATIGIRGTQFDVRVCAGNCGALADGTYVAVKFGAVQASNSLGSIPVAAGQVATVPPQRPPLILPRDPGIGFTPPAVIPKLDERKKVQAQQAAAANEQAKPSGQQATAQSSQPGQKSPQEGAKSDSGGKSEGTAASRESGTGSGTKASGSGTGGSGAGPQESSPTAQQSSSTPNSSGANLSSAAASPANSLPTPTQAPAGVTCSVE